jgi:protein associated with RNAse G/E
MFYVLSKLNHDFDITVVLQNCMDMLKSEPYSSTEKHIMLSDEVNEVVGIKVEEITELNEEEDGESTSPVIKIEPPVSSISVCIQCYARRKIQNCLSVCLSA